MVPLREKELAALSKQGRKRGVLTAFCIQGLADFDKSVARGIQNRLVGRTTLDNDMTRAARSLGLKAKGRADLEVLPDRRFFARGPAFGVWGTTVVDAAPVRTRPSRKAQRFGPPPPPSESMREILEALGNLRPEEPAATDPAGDPEQLKARIKTLEERLTARPAAEQEIERRLEGFRLEKEAALAPLRDEISALRRRLEAARTGARDLLALLAAEPPKEHPGKDERERSKDPPEAGSPPPAVESRDAVVGPLAEPRRRILEGLSYLEQRGSERVHRANLAVLADLSPRSSSYAAHLSAMHAEGLIAYPEPGWVSLSERGRDGGRPGAGRALRHTPAPDALRAAWLRYLPDAQGRILAALLERHPGDLARPELAALAGQSARSSSYADHLASLKALGLADYPTPGRVRVGPRLLERGRA